MTVSKLLSFISHPPLGVMIESNDGLLLTQDEYIPKIHPKTKNTFNIRHMKAGLNSPLS